MLEKHYSADLSVAAASRDTVSLSAIWLTLVRQYRLILKITGALLGLAILFVMFSTPTFLSASSLYTSGIQATAPVSDATLPNATASTYLNYLSNFVSVNDVQTQVDILSNPALVQEAVLASGLNVVLKGPGINMPFYIIWKLFYGGSMGTYAPDQSSLTASFASFADPAVRTRRYHVTFAAGGQYTVDYQGNDVLHGVLNQPASGGGLSLLLQSPNPSLAPAAGSVYLMVVSAPSITADNILTSGFTASIGGTLTSPSEVINLQLRYTNPYQAQAFLNALMNAYIDKTVSWNSTSASKMEDFITQQLGEVQAKMTAADEKLADYQRATGVISPPDNATSAINQESQYESQRAELQIEIKALGESLASLDNPNGAINPYLISQAGGTPISLLSEKLAEDLATLKSDQARFSGSSPDIAALEAQVAQERVGVRSMLKNELDDAQANLDGVNSEIATYQAQIGAMPAQSLEVIGLTRSSEVLGDLYVLLMQKQQEAEISKTAAVSSTQIIMPAQLPYKASSPKPTIVLPLALIAGLLGGSTWVVLRNAWQGRLTTDSEISDLLKSPIFGTVPTATIGAPGGHEAEFAQSLQFLRFNVEHALADSPSKIVLLTAASAEAEKSGIALNLAKALAEDGKRVALVDADFRTGRLRGMLHADAGPSLSQWLLHGVPVALQKPKGENFALLPAGASAAQGMPPFSEARIAGVLEELNSKYDYVVLDGPTSPSTADLLAFAVRADLILSVVQTGVALRKSEILHHNAIAKVTALQGLVVISSYA